MTTAEIQAIMIFSAVIVGVTSAGYLYQSVSPFLSSLRRALRLISFGMLLITFGVLVAASIIFSPELGNPLLATYETASSALFYALFIAGCVLILLGGRQFSTRPSKKVVDVSLREVADKK